MSGREPVMQALFSLLTSSIASTFAGTTSIGSPVVTGIASTAGLFVGLPATSARTPNGSTILSIDSATQVTLSEPATSAGSGVVFTTGFRTTGRRLKLWGEVAAQPALFLRSASEEIAPRAARMPSRVTMLCEAWVYSNAGAAVNAVPAATLNHIIDAIMQVLEPSPIREVQTLGGLVHNCWIEGQIDLHPGDLDGQAIAVVPIHILLPNPLPIVAIAATAPIATPGQVIGLTVGVITSNSVALSWSAPATGGAVDSYTVQYRITGAGSWTTANSAVAGTAYTVGGLSGATSYDFQVIASNAGGSGPASASVSATTLNYLLTAGFQPTAGANFTAGTGTVPINVNDNSAGIDGAHTVPNSVRFALSTSNSVTPGSWVNGAPFTNAGHNYWAVYHPTPATPGAYHYWAQARDAAGNVVFTLVSAATWTVN